MKAMTVVVCTHNRAELLGKCMESISGQRNLTDLDVVVVDNASTDSTPGIISEWASIIPGLRYVYEATPGIAHARNRGLTESKCLYTAYLDDDVVAEPDWAESILRALEVSRADTVGGRTLLYWEKRAPRWVGKGLHAFLGESDLGDSVISEKLGYVPNGANMAFSTDLLRRLGGFNRGLGVISLSGQEKTVLLGEDSDMGMRVLRARGRIVYAGGAVVRHLVDDRRCTLRTLWSRAEQRGRTVATLEPESLDRLAIEDGWVWSTACCISCVIRWHLRDAIAFALWARVHLSTRRHLAVQGERQFNAWRAMCRSVNRQRNGLLGVVRRTLIGKPLSSSNDGLWSIS